jgi:hypothetical protein
MYGVVIAIVIVVVVVVNASMTWERITSTRMYNPRKTCTTIILRAAANTETWSIVGWLG